MRGRVKRAQINQVTVILLFRFRVTICIVRNNGTVVRTRRRALCKTTRLETIWREYVVIGLVTGRPDRVGRWWIRCLLTLMCFFQWRAVIVTDNPKRRKRYSHKTKDCDAESLVCRFAKKSCPPGLSALQSVPAGVTHASKALCCRDRDNVSFHPFFSPPVFVSNRRTRSEENRLFREMSTDRARVHVLAMCVRAARVIRPDVGSRVLVPLTAAATAPPRSDPTWSFRGKYVRWSTGNAIPPTNRLAIAVCNILHWRAHKAVHTRTGRNAKQFAV